MTMKIKRDFCMRMWEKFLKGGMVLLQFSEENMNSVIFIVNFLLRISLYDKPIKQRSFAPYQKERKCEL